MALQSTSKIRLFISSQKEEDLLSFLQKERIMEIVSVREEERSDINHSAEFAVSKLDFAIRYLSQYATKKEGIRNTILGEKIEISDETAKDLVSGFHWEEGVEKVSFLESTKNDIVRKLTELKVVLASFISFDGITIKAEEGLFFPSFFILPLRTAHEFEEGVKEISSFLDLSRVKESDSFVCFVLFSKQEVKELALQILAQKSGSEIHLEKGVSPSQKIQKLQKEISALEEDFQKNKEEAKDLSLFLDNFKMCYDEYFSKEKLNTALRGAEQTFFLSVFEGWVETSRKEELEKKLVARFGAVEIEEMELKNGEITRVILHSSPLIEPVMEVTKMYGIPKIEEVDPTPYYAFFFLVFFGFCLTDAGYGLLLTAMTGAVLSFHLPFEKNVIAMIKLFMYGGISTFILGTLFGGWFGLTPDQVPDFLTYGTGEILANGEEKRLFLGQIFDPMTDLVTKIMPVTYVLGLIHLSLGLYLSGLIAWKAGNKNRMLFVTLPMIFSFIFASLTWVLGIAFFEYIFYITLCFTMWGLGESGNPVLRMLKGFGGLLNESLGWFSNILSYSRLFALGLATGIIAMSFNLVALTMGEMVPGILGVIVMLFILAFGHSLNIALNLLGAYVHSSRLQFVEFFGMFLEGGGKSFNPLRLVSRFRHTS